MVGQIGNGASYSIRNDALSDTLLHVAENGEIKEVGEGYAFNSGRNFRPRLHGHFFFDKVGFSQKNVLVYIQFCDEVSLSNACDKDERAK